MKISICIPVMGRVRLLFEALCSILLQTHADVELVIQDGDPDHPARNDPKVHAILDFFHPNFNYKAERDHGIYDAGNMCFRRATGDIIYFMGSDDLLVPGALAAVSVAFEAERFGGPFWLYGQTISADVTGRALGVDGHPTTYDEMLEYNRLGSPAVFWNRRMMELAGVFDTRYKWSAEYELWLRFWRRREPLFLDQALGVFRHHEGNASQTHTEQLEEEVDRIQMRHSTLGAVMDQARNRLVASQAYGGDMPAGERG